MLIQYYFTRKQIAPAKLAQLHTADTTAYDMFTESTMCRILRHVLSPARFFWLRLLTSLLLKGAMERKHKFGSLFKKLPF